MKIGIVALFIAASVAATTNVFAQVNTSAPGEWRYGIGLGAVNIDKEIAEEELIDSSALFVGLYADYRKNRWLTSIGMDFIVYDDSAEFFQTVEGNGLFNDGDISTESSDANALLAHVATGYEWLFTEQQDVAVLLQAGYGHVFGSERAIPNCSNCRTESIDVDGGVFAKAAVTKDAERFTFGVYAQQFLTGDGFSNTLGLAFSTKF